MLYLLDSAKLSRIERGFELYPLAGVTTNPALIARERTGFSPLISAIRRMIGPTAMLHVQTLSPDCDGIVEEGRRLADLAGPAAFVKIPVTAAGIRAIRILTAEGIAATATAVFTPQQALLAAVAGAAFVAPYVNRLDSISGDGARVVAEIVQLFKIHGLPAKVLAASFRNAEQVHRVSLAGSHAVTLSPDILDSLLSHPLTDAGVEQFVLEWEQYYGAGKRTTEV